jgi:integrase/recombinase XerD
MDQFLLETGVGELRRAARVTHVEAGNYLKAISNNAPSTRRTKSCLMSAFYDKLVMARIIDFNPFLGQMPKKPSRWAQVRPTEALEPVDVQRILAAPDATSTRGIRDRALLCLLFGGGLRRSEVVGLKINDVRLVGQYCVLRLWQTKNGDVADQGIPSWAFRAVADYIQLRYARGAKHEDLLFDSLTASGLYKIFKRYCDRCGFRTRFSPHSARATAITKLLTDGHDYRAVQEFSRHSSVYMVEVYDKRFVRREDNPANLLDYKPAVDKKMLTKN